MDYQEKLARKLELKEKMKPHEEELLALNREINELKKGCTHPKELWIDHGSYYDNERSNRRGEMGTYMYPRECKLCGTWMHLTEKEVKDWEDE